MGSPGQVRAREHGPGQVSAATYLPGIRDQGSVALLGCPAMLFELGSLYVRSSPSVWVHRVQWKQMGRWVGVWNLLG
jgi:hypothetical protein